MMMDQRLNDLTPLPGEWYWGIICPTCGLHCPMHRDIQQGIAPTSEIVRRSPQSHQARIAGECGHCHIPFDVPAEQFHLFQIPDHYYD